MFSFRPEPRTTPRCSCCVSGSAARDVHSQLCTHTHKRTHTPAAKVRFPHCCSWLSIAHMPERLLVWGPRWPFQELSGGLDYLKKGFSCRGCSSLSRASPQVLQYTPHTAFRPAAQTALPRSRCRYVPEKVIRKMAANIQPPNPERFKWECHTAVVEGAWDWSSTNTSGCRSSKGLCASGGAFQEEGGPGREGGARDDAGVQWSFWRVIAAAAEDLLAPSSPVSSAASLLQQVPYIPAVQQQKITLDLMVFNYRGRRVEVHRSSRILCRFSHSVPRLSRMQPCRPSCVLCSSRGSAPLAAHWTSGLTSCAINVVDLMHVQSSF